MDEAKQILAHTDNIMIKPAAIPGIQRDDEHNCLYLQQTVAIEARLKQITSRKKNTDHSVNGKSYRIDCIYHIHSLMLLIHTRKLSN